MTTTLWLPDAERLGVAVSEGKSLANAICEALALDISMQRLLPGDILPTQRLLARRLSLSLGTVHRAYQLATTRGLIRGEVGRGCFVLEHRNDQSLSRLSLPSQQHFRSAGVSQSNAVEIAGGIGRRIVDLSRNLALPESLPNDLARRVRDAISAVELHDYLGRDPAGGSTPARLAGARWMENFASGPDVGNTRDTDFRETLVLGGGQLALNAIICALTKPGDSILVDALTFPGLRLAAQLHHVHLVPLAGHSNRTEPDVLATAMRKHKAKLWFCMPTLHNPTATVMSARLRSKLAEVANASGLVVVEDDVYGFLNPGVSSLAEQCTQGIRLVSMAKSTLAGLRVAYLRTNEHLAVRLRSSIEALCWMATPASSSLATSLIANGTAKALADWKRGELTTRLALARSLLGRRLSCGASASLHAWLSLPDRWNTSSFTASCWDRGVQVSPSDEFVATPRTTSPNGVRISLGTTATPEELEQSLEIVADVLHSGKRVAKH